MTKEQLQKLNNIQTKIDKLIQHRKIVKHHYVSNTRLKIAGDNNYSDAEIDQTFFNIEKDFWTPFNNRITEEINRLTNELDSLVIANKSDYAINNINIEYPGHAE